MFLRSLHAPLTAIRGVGSASLPLFARLGITDISDLLCHYPREWEDLSKKVPIKDYRTGRVCTDVTVVAKDWIGYGRMKTLKIFIEDESGGAVLLCFNRNWMEKDFIQGRRFRIWGRFFYKYGEIQSSAFEYEALDPDGGAAGGFGEILPVYPLTAGIKMKKMRSVMKQALDRYAAALENELPAEIIGRDAVMPKAQAIRAVHFPSSRAELEQAKKAIIYEELFYLELIVGKRAQERRALSAGGSGPHPHVPTSQPQTQTPTFSPLQLRLLERLPFSLTAGQQKAIYEINADMSGPYPMARLLQGDVGSGKTLVSFLAALRSVENGGQAAIMAPTELLARQHAENASRLLEPLGLRIAFLTGNIRAAGRRELLRSLASGGIDVVVGTHALFSQDVEYSNLSLVVIDEQHRFGVTQRSLIMAKGRDLVPHLLMMSATPIPRTLALTIFGDMDVSVIGDMPPGRKPVMTRLAKESNERKVYDFVRRQLAMGRQAYFVYPLIDSGDESDLKDAVSMADRLVSEVFPEFPVALIHSRLDEEEKRQTMEKFRSGAVKILVATSVVEVGVDVPNAACMVIEHAERFGLSALHQLRGRVGRGADQSYCFLVFSDELGEEGKQRLRVMYENTDGFVIADEDLKLRGPGQIAGIEQSGYFTLGLASPVRDIQELVRARDDAFAILESDPNLLLESHRVIARVMEEAPPAFSYGL